MGTSTAPQGQPLAGIIMMCVGVACLTINDAFAKALTTFYPSVQILFLRNLIALPFAVLIALRMGGHALLRSHRPVTHLWRGMIWVCAGALFFTGLRHLGLAEATVLIFAAPVFITALAALVLKEPVGWRRWSAVVVGFLGVLIVVRPGLDTFHPASVFPIGSAALYAVLMISARWVDPRESVWTLMLYLVGTGALLCGIVSPFIWAPLRGEDIWMFLALAVFGTAGMTLMTQAFRMAPAAAVAPFDYTALIWSTVLGWVIWTEVPDFFTFAGALIISSSGLFIVFRERANRT